SARMACMRASTAAYLGRPMVWRQTIASSEAASRATSAAAAPPPGAGSAEASRAAKSSTVSWPKLILADVAVGQAGVDGQDGAGDLGRALRGEEQRRLGHVGAGDVQLERAALAVNLGQVIDADPAAGGTRLAPLAGPQAAALENGVRRKAVDADSERPRLLGQAAGQVQLAGFGRGVGGGVLGR